MTPPPDTKERLVTTAARLWHATSYADVGVSEICEQADVKKGSFYHFFPSKRDVALAVLDARRDQALEYVFGPALKADAPPLERLRRLIHVQYELQARIKAESGAVRGCPIGNLALELSTQDELIRQRCVELFEGWATLIEPLLEEAATRGELPPVDIERAAMAVTAYVEGILLLAKTHNDAEIIQQLAGGVPKLVAAFATASDN